MKLEKAISLIEQCAKTHARYDRVETKEALKLGIEALRYRLKLEQENGDITLEPLPGETEE